MKLLFAVFLSNLLILFSQFSCGQAGRKTEKIEVNSTVRYEIPDENKVISRLDFNEPSDTVKAGLIVDNNDLIKIRFSRAKINGDTVQIILYEDNEAFDNRFSISIVKNQYVIDYKFLIDISEDSIGEIVPEQSEVEVNSLDFKKGKEIRGRVYFKGRRKNSNNNEWVVVKGNFKVII